eukprot:gnl/MRDRNA2_/MRDRNA2_65369_c0_seq2.p1 gnl/MRDRNA2_/MRDRNA2_65369_c0~~gnl/MRDRNA2_/MRDRNA2_65369_c0_seq2.p1  ORF type:complete len:103 (+),score=5.65 gnl/MRDRNA2_/MRDRNA2_65369_c0_seq2:24-311(+)
MPPETMVAGRYWGGKYAMLEGRPVEVPAVIVVAGRFNEVVPDTVIGRCAPRLADLTEPGRPPPISPDVIILGCCPPVPPDSIRSPKCNTCLVCYL